MKLAVPVIAGAAVLALTNVALAKEANLASADQPIVLTETQMDSVTAGHILGFSIVTNTSIAVDGLVLVGPTSGSVDVTIDVLAITHPDPFINANAFAQVP